MNLFREHLAQGREGQPKRVVGDHTVNFPSDSRIERGEPNFTAADDNGAR